MKVFANACDPVSWCKLLGVSSTKLLSALTTYFGTGAGLYAAVKDPSVTFTLVETLPIEVGSFQITGMVDEGLSLALIGSGLYAIVQKFDIRRESVIHSLYYGKNNPLLR